MATVYFGEYFRRLRLDRGLTLRAYCQGKGEDPAYISRLERGLIGTPRDEAVLNRLAKSLGINEGTGEWRTFFDLADISGGRIPRRIMEDEDLVKHLPLFFRTVLGERFPDEKLDGLIAYVRELYSGEST